MPGIIRQVAVETAQEMDIVSAMLTWMPEAVITTWVKSGGIRRIWNGAGRGIFGSGMSPRAANHKHDVPQRASWLGNGGIKNRRKGLFPLVVLVNGALDDLLKAIIRDLLQSSVSLPLEVIFNPAIGRGPQIELKGTQFRIFFH